MRVARAADVSRSWIYRQADLRAEIDRLRTSRAAPTAPVPSAQRASTDSLRRRREATLDEIQRLKIENHQLRQQVAKRFGQQRADGLPLSHVEDMSPTWTPRPTRPQRRPLQIRLNTKLRLLTRIAFGFRSPEALVALAMLDLGGLCPPLPGRATP